MQRLFTFVAAGVFVAAPLCAQSSSPALQVHGFADWGAGRSNGGTYEFGSERGTMSAGTFAIVMNAIPGPKISVVAQLGFNGLGHDITEPKLDIIFAQYTLSDALKLNIGRVKQPFGEYSEIFDVGTAHNMLSLPHGEYDLSGAMGEVFNGVGFTGGRYATSGWGVRYDGYVGDITVATATPWVGAGEEEQRLLRQIIGGRGVIETPFSGLSFGASAYTGRRDDSLLVSDGVRHSAYGAQADWANARFSVRTEIVRTQEPSIQENAAYVETTARVSGGWQLSGRFDTSRASGADIVGTNSALSRHTDIAYGLNYWVVPGFVLRAEIHDVVGNRYLAPRLESDLGKRTRIVQFGSQFSF